jgi:hypothetical protein
MSKNRIEILVPCQIFEQKKAIAKAMAKTMPTAADFAPVNAQPDLLFMRSILVSTGENKNDDVFLPEEMWNARSTPVLKPVDWEHNTGRELTPTEQAENPGKVIVDNQTIGVMYNAYTVDENKEIIDEARASASDFEVPKEFHIIDEAVIWKALYPSVARRVEEGAAKGTLFVSMEAWFTDYYYLVGSKVVARNEQTAFLDRSLRANGGSGSYAGERVRRALRNITFGGKGIVARPANAPSIITHVSHEPISAEASINKAIAENIICDIRNTKANEPRKDMEMPNENKEQQVSLELYAKANDENVNLRAESKTKDAELAKANEKVAELKAQAENLASALAKGAESLDELLPGFSAKVGSNPENLFVVIAEAIEAAGAKKAELQKQLEASLAEIGEIKLSARTAARDAKISALLGIAEMHGDEEKEKKAKEKKDKMMAAVSDLNDEQFDALFEVWADEKAEAKKPPFLEKKDEKDGDDKKDDEKEAKGGPMKKGASVEDTVREVLASMAKASASEKEVNIDELVQTAAGQQEPTDEENLMALLDNVQASEQAPSAGAEAPQGVDLRSSFGGLVGRMLGRDDEENN